MDKRVPQGIIRVIRAEKKRRAAALRNAEDDQGLAAAFHNWQFSDLPFVNELCLMLLVAMRHQVERELVRLAARTLDGGKEITHDLYRKRIAKVDGDWRRMASNLRLTSYVDYPAMEALRLLGNSYKHSPSKQPAMSLLKHLNLDTKKNYLPLPDSDYLREGLALYIGLGKDADYCEITERFLMIAHRFLAEIEKQTTLSRIKPQRVSLGLDDFAG